MAVYQRRVPERSEKWTDHLLQLTSNGRFVVSSVELGFKGFNFFLQFLLTFC